MEIAFVHRSGLGQPKHALSLAVKEAGERQREAFHHQGEQHAAHSGSAGASGGGMCESGARSLAGDVISRGASGVSTEELSPGPILPSEVVEAGAGGEQYGEGQDQGVALRLLVVWGDDFGEKGDGEDEVGYSAYPEDHHRLERNKQL